MNINDKFPSKWLSAADLGQAKPVVIITHLTEERMQEGEDPKPVLHFQNKKKGMVLNKTNAMNVAQIYGPETDNWIGKPVRLYTTFVDFAGKSVNAIRIEPQVPQINDGGQQAPLPQTHQADNMEMPPEGPEDAYEEDIPW